MKKRLVAWLPEDEIENICKYDVSFKIASEVIQNPLTLALENLHSDYSYIGFCDDVSLLVYVYCIREEEFTRIVIARRATKEEKDEFFKIIRGEN